MEQITVPQFVESEDRIIGPITIRQFVIMFVAGIIIFICFKLLDFTIFLMIAILLGGSSLILAFFKVNGQAFHFFILNIIRAGRRPSLRVWRKDGSNQGNGILQEEVAISTKEGSEEERFHVSEKRLSELSLIVDTGGAYKGDPDSQTELF